MNNKVLRIKLLVALAASVAPASSISAINDDHREKLSANLKNKYHFSAGEHKEVQDKLSKISDQHAKIARELMDLTIMHGKGVMNDDQRNRAKQAIKNLSTHQTELAIEAIHHEIKAQGGTPLPFDRVEQILHDAASK